MNPYRRKSALLFKSMLQSPRSHAAWLLFFVGAAIGLSTDLREALVKFPTADEPTCRHPLPEATAGRPSPEQDTGLRFSLRRLAPSVFIGEQRRVCAWRKLSDEASATFVLIIAWIAAAAGSVGLVRPFRQWFGGRLRAPTNSQFNASATAVRTPADVASTRFDLCFAQAADAIMIVQVTESQNFIYSDINAAWQRIFADDAGSGAGRQPHDVLPPALIGAMTMQFRRCVAAGAPIRFQTKSAKCGERDLVVVVTPIREPAAAHNPGRITSLFCLAHDNTEQVQLALHTQHEQRLEIVRRLSAGVAHDFNNILQAVCGGLELIADEAGPGEAGPAPAVRELANIVLVAAQRGSHLTQHLLAYARRQVLTPQPIDLREFLPRMRVALEQAIGPANVLDLAFCGEHATIFVDELNLRTALLNLAFNAGRAMPDGGRFRIESSLDAENHPACVRMLINDTGHGMDAATLEHCQEPFFTTKGATGTGLGLSMVQGFAIQSGGTLHLASRPGQGTSAMLTLPACRPSSAPTPISRTRNVNGRVLLVDDAADVLITTGRMLRRAGLTVTTVQSGDAALAELAAGHVFDILITDYAMPGLSGVELIRLAREMQPGLPGLIITGFHEVDISRLQETAHVVQKPFQRQDLIDAIQEWMVPEHPPEVPSAVDQASPLGRVRSGLSPYEPSPSIAE